MIKNYRNVISSNVFELEPEQATRITEKTNTCLDHCFHQNLFESSFELLEHENISDHLPILLKWKTKYILCDNASQFKDKSFLKKHDLVSNYLECLKNNMNQAYDEMQTRTDLSRSFEIFKKHFENCLNIYAPMKQFNIVPKNCPKWFDNRLKNLRVRRNRAFQNWKSNKNDTKLQKFNSLRSQFEDETKGANRKFYLNKFNSCIGDSRQTYKLLNGINGKKVTNNTIPCLDSLSEKILRHQIMILQIV